jgi:hypothetical protein
VTPQKKDLCLKKRIGCDKFPAYDSTSVWRLSVVLPDLLPAQTPLTAIASSTFFFLAANSNIGFAVRKSHNFKAGQFN